MESGERPILEYVTPPPPKARRVATLHTWMHIWRYVAAFAAAAYLASLVAFPAASIALSCCVAVASFMTLYQMARLAAAEMGRGYAIRHVLLAIMFTPVLLLGVFLVPFLVENDIAKFNQIERDEGVSREMET